MQRTSRDAALTVLVVRVGAMGDVLHALPAVCALRQLRPDCWIGWAIAPRWRPLLSSRDPSFQADLDRRTMPVVNHCFVAPTDVWKREGASVATARSMRQLARELRQAHFDVCADLQGSIRSAVIGRMTASARLVGSGAPRERPAKLLYQERVRVCSTHVVQQACELLGAAVEAVLQPAPVILPHDLEADEWAAATVRAAERTVLLAPTAGWGSKEWLPERFGAVAHALAERGFKVLVNAASARDDTALRVVGGSAGRAQMVPCTLPRLVALTRLCSLVIAGDSGPLHLAAALGVPVVGLYGPTDPNRTGPWSARATVLRDPASVTDHKRHATTEAGLCRITVEQVVDAALELLSYD